MNDISHVHVMYNLSQVCQPPNQPKALSQFYHPVSLNEQITETKDYTLETHAYSKSRGQPDGSRINAKVFNDFMNNSICGQFYSFALENQSPKCVEGIFRLIFEVCDVKIAFKPKVLLCICSSVHKTRANMGKTTENFASLQLSESFQVGPLFFLYRAYTQLEYIHSSCARVPYHDNKQNHRIVGLLFKLH